MRVIAYNTIGDGPASAESTATPLSTAPSPATLTAGSISTSGATLTLGVHTAAWYYKKTAPTPAGNCIPVNANTSNVTLSSLNTGTTHTYKAYSDSACSLELATETFPTLPGQVTGTPTVTARHKSLAVSWTALTGQTVTGYKVQWKTSTQQWDAVNRQVTVSGITSTAGTITGLTNATAYTVRVLAYNESGNGAASSTATGTPVAATLTQSSVTATGATITIGNYVDAWYWKKTAPTPAGSCSAVVAAGTDNATLSSLTAGTSHTFKAYSDSTCSTEVATVSFLTLPGQVTGTPTITAEHKRLLVSWTALASQTVTGYKVQWKSGSQEFDASRQTTVSGIASTSGTIASLTNATQYTVRGAGLQRQRRRCGFEHGHGHAGGGDLGVEFGGSGNRHLDHRQVEWRLVLQGQRGAGQHLPGSGERRDVGEEPHRPVRQHLLHLQGVQRQRLLDRTGGGHRVPDQARQAHHADGGHRGRR